MHATQNQHDIAGAHSRHSFDRATRITARGYPHRRRIWRTPAPQHAIVTRNHTSVLSHRQGPQHALGRRHWPSHCFRRTDFHQRRRHKVDHVQVPVAPKEYSNSRRSMWSGPSESDTIHAFRLHNRGTRDRRSIAQRERTRVRRLISPVDNIGLPRLYRCGIRNVHAMPMNTTHHTCGPKRVRERGTVKLLVYDCPGYTINPRAPRGLFKPLAELPLSWQST